MNGTSPLFVLGITLVISTGAVWSFSRVAHSLGIIDTPGGRKAHSHPVPLVGGLAIYLTLLVVATVGGIATNAGYFLLALAIIIAVGLWDDVTEVSPRLKFFIQIIATAIMIGGAGIELRTVGNLLGLRPIGLWVFAIPMTVFAVVGVVNCVNMMDGMDGLGGSIAFVAFAWYAAVAWASNLDVQFNTALIFCGAIGGFLLFNLRFPWQTHARVFLGDAGSLMIGFALAWFAIDLTQGFGRTFPPIAALWILLLPLADCVSLMARRVRAGCSPFLADRRHIHHYFLARGLSHGQTLAILVTASLSFGAVGFFSWRLQLPEPLLFVSFFAGFFSYHFWIKREWRKLDEKTLQLENNTFAPSVPDEVRDNVLPSS